MNTFGHTLPREPAPPTFRKSVVWAVDPFAHDDELQSKTLAAVQCSFPESPIYPVFVLSEETFRAHGSTAFLRPALKPLALKALEGMIEENHAINVRQPRVLVEPTASHTACARKLMRFSELVGASSIAISSHAKSSLSRFFSGSFHDEMLSFSEIPLFITGPEIRTDLGAPTVVVYPTDFSKGAAQSLDQVLLICKRLGADLHLFHTGERHIDPVLQSGVHVLGGGWVSLETFWTSDTDPFQEEELAWVEYANSFGVKTKFVTDKTIPTAARTVLEYLNELKTAPPLLAVAGGLLGGLTKDMIRRSPCPVYVVA
jgi:nucleotide-binding universal stress UspA family protein